MNRMITQLIQVALLAVLSAPSLFGQSANPSSRLKTRPVPSVAPSSDTATPPPQAPKVVQEPYGFKSVILGMAVADLPKRTGREGRDETTLYYDSVAKIECYSGGEKKLCDYNVLIIIDSFNGKVSSIRFGSLKQFEFPVVVTGLTEKFGKPNEVLEESVQNRMGAVFVKRKYVWDNGVSRIEASRIDAIGEAGDVSYTHKALIEESRKANKSKATL